MSDYAPPPQQYAPSSEKWNVLSIVAFVISLLGFNIVAVILGALVLGEPIGPRTLVAGAIIVGAVALIVTARSRMAGPRVAAVEVTIPPGPSEPRVAPRPSRSASG